MRRNIGSFFARFNPLGACLENLKIMEIRLTLHYSLHMPKPILIASDHAGVSLKAILIKELKEFKFEDLGPADNSRVDYPDYAEKVAQIVSQDPTRNGVLICGSGIGMSIAANKFKNVRAAHVTNPAEARLAKEHNDAQIACIGSRFLGSEYAVEIVREFLKTPYSNDARHTARIQKISKLD